VVNAQDFGIPVQMPFGIYFVFMTQRHDVRMGLYIDGVLVTASIVGSIVDVKYPVPVHAVSRECHGVAFLIGKCMLLTIVWNVLVAGQ